jgi:hypothetical protein
MKNKTFLLLLIFFSIQTFAQPVSDKKFIMIRQFKGQEQLSRSLSSSLNRTVLKYLASLPGYELLLNSSSPPNQTLMNIYAVEGKIERGQNSLSFNLDLLDIKKNVVVNTVKKTDIREEDFIRLIQGGLEALFLSIKEVPVEEKKRNKTSERIKDNEIPPIVTNKANNSAIDFKQRIKGLQDEADIAVNKKQQLNQSSEESSAANMTSSSSTGEALLSSTDFGQFEKKQKSTARVIKREFNIEVSYEKRTIDTNSYIQTISQLNILNLHANGNIWHNENKNVFFRFNAGLGKPLASELPAPNLYNFGVQTIFSIKDQFIGLGLKREDLLFFNIDTPGAGLKSGTIQANWAQILVELNPILKNKLWNIKTQYSTSISSSSGWKPLKEAKSFQGNSIGIDVGIPYPVYGALPRLQFQQTEMVGKSNNGVTLKDTRVALGATYFF